MKKLSIFISFAMLTFSAAVGAQTLDELAEIVRRAASSEGQINQ